MEKLCIICGENDEVMFYPNRKNKCKKCMSDEYKNKSEDEKKVIFEMYGKKILGGLNPNQMSQLKANKELLLKLTQY